MEQRHAARRREFLRSVRNASSDEERRSATKRYFEDYLLPAIDEMAKIAEQQPATDVAKRAAIWVVRHCDPDYRPHQRAAALLLTHHALAGEVGSACENLDGFDPVYERLLRVVAASHPSAAARGHASFHLAELLVRRASFRATMEATPELREERVKHHGEELETFLESINPARDRKEAMQLYKLVQQKYPDVPYGDGTLGDVAAERQRPFEQTYSEIGAHAPSIEGRDLDGNPRSLASFRGKVVVLTFWASWCGECLNRIPEENKLVDELRDADFALLGVNGDEALADARRAASEHGVQFPSWWDDPGAKSTIVDQWSITEWPTTFVLDRAGVIRYKNLSGAELRSAVNQLLEDGSPAAPEPNGEQAKHRRDRKGQDS
jgi:peroxiredoxin